MGGDSWYLVLRKRCTADTSLPSAALTTTDEFSQSLPPLPEDEEASTVSESHPPTLAGATMTTAGATALTGALRATTTDDEAVGQVDCWEQSLVALTTQAALTAAPAATDTLLPAEKQPEPIAVTVALSAHWHLVVLAQAKLNTSLHTKEVLPPALLVLESNFMVK